MSKLRLLFVKEAQASYISHLDLMRTFQRCFPRTELDIKHTFKGLENSFENRHGVRYKLARNNLRRSDGRTYAYFRARR